MTKKKPLVVVTRQLPDLVETRMRELFDARLNLDDKPMSQAEIVEAMREADVLVPTITDHINAAHDRPGGRADEADRQFRQRRRPHRRHQRAPARHHGHQHAGRPDRRHRRHDDGADPFDGAPARRGLADHSRRATGPAGRRPGCSGAGSPASGSASSAWAGSARRSPAARAPSACRSTITTAAASPQQIEESLEATYWDSLDQMLARMDFVSVNCPHTPGDLSSAVGAAAQISAPRRHSDQYGARRGDRRERA